MLSLTGASDMRSLHGGLRRLPGRCLQAALQLLGAGRRLLLVPLHGVIDVLQVVDKDVGLAQPHCGAQLVQRRRVQLLELRGRSEPF